MTTSRRGRRVGGPDAGSRYLYRIDQPKLRRTVLEPVAVEEVRYIVSFRPAAVGTAEVKALMGVSRGEIVVSVSAQKVASAASTSAIAIGDGDEKTRFVPFTDTETGAVGDTIQPKTENFPYTYPADDTIDVTYVIGGTPGETFPEWVITIILIPQPGQLHRGATHAQHG